MVLTEEQKERAIKQIKLGCKRRVVNIKKKDGRELRYNRYSNINVGQVTEENNKELDELEKQFTPVNEQGKEDVNTDKKNPQSPDSPSTIPPTIPPPVGTSPSDLAVANMVAGPIFVQSKKSGKGVDVTKIPDYHVEEAAWNHAVNSGIGNICFLRVWPYVSKTITIDEMEKCKKDASLMVTTFDEYLNGTVFPLLEDANQALRFKIAYLTAVDKVKELVEQYNRLWVAYIDVKGWYEILNMVADEQTRVKFMTLLMTRGTVNLNDSGREKTEGENPLSKYIPK